MSLENSYLCTMNILSLFDGMSCGQIALNRAGIKYDNYFASEIDKYAIAITKYNFPNTIHLGDIINLKYIDGKLYKNNELAELIKEFFEIKDLGYIPIDTSAIQNGLEIKLDSVNIK